MNFEIDEKNVEKSFDIIAEKLFKDFKMVANNTIYRFLEIEFYYHSDENRDNQTYQNEKQKTNGKWFFHYSGIDITIGSDNSHGGILIRSIGKLDSNGQISEYICGPLKLKDELLNNYNSVDTNSKFLCLENVPNIFIYDRIKDYKKTVRIGIDKKKDNFGKEYRHVLFADKFPKTYRPKIQTDKDNK